MEVVERMKKGIVDYILEHCAAALGVSPERITSKNLRDYCYMGFTEDEFLSVWLREGLHRSFGSRCAARAFCRSATRRLRWSCSASTRRSARASRSSTCASCSRDCCRSSAKRWGLRSDSSAGGRQHASAVLLQHLRHEGRGPHHPPRLPRLHHRRVAASWLPHALAIARAALCSTWSTPPRST